MEMANDTPETIYDSTVHKYAEFINPYLTKLLSFAGFGVETHGEGCYLYDHEGRKFLDCLGGYGTFSLGHRHPKVVQAVTDQLGHLGLSGKTFFTKPAADLAEKLAVITPGNLQYSFFCNSGTEAVEAALKFAKGSTGRKKIVSTDGSYHGKTMGALSTTGREKYRKPFEPLVPGVEFVPYGDLAALERIVDEATACVILEPIQGEGGIIIPPDGYLSGARRICDRTGALLILDEVQTGLGRTGYLFGANYENVTPDLMTLAKALGGGIMPLGAVIGTPAIWESIFSKNPLAHTSTFGANALATAAGCAAIDAIQEENAVQNSAAMGKVLLEGLKGLQSRFPDLIAEVRGRGLMIGIEFAIDEVGELVVGQCVKRGLICAYTLNNPRVIRIEPPLIINQSQCEFAIETFTDSVAETAELMAALA